MRVRFPLALAILIVSQFQLPAEENWNQFRGPRGDGISEAKNLPAKIEEGSDVIKWKTPIDGKAWSSPVLWGEQIWLTNAPEDGKWLSAVCVDAKSGKIIHDIKVFDVPKPYFCHPTNSYASCTPYVESGRVYVHFGRYGTACLDTTTGKKLWENRDLDCNHFRGPAASPVVHGDRIFLAFDGIDVQFVVALDKNTGKVVWNTERDIDYGTTNGDRMKAYSTGSIIDVDGQALFVSPAAVETIAYTLSDGKPVWRVRHGGMNAAARPLFVDGLLYLSAGSGNTSLVAVRPKGKGDLTDSIVWSTGKGVPRRSSQIISDGLLYMTSDDGVATCLDAKTGDTKWVKRLKGAHWASPVLADGKFYSMTREHGTFVIDIETHELLAQNKLSADDSYFDGTPAVTESGLILRSNQNLYCVAKE